LTDADIRRHVAGTVNPETERHVRICVCCERRGPLRRLVRVDNAQAVDELLAKIAREQRREAA
jgi:hypothetical protein